MMGEISPTQKDKCHIFSLNCGNQYAKPVVGNEMQVCRDMSWDH